MGQQTVDMSTFLFLLKRDISLQHFPLVIKILGPHSHSI
jgi:hypothetical protein